MKVLKLTCENGDILYIAAEHVVSFWRFQGEPKKTYIDLVSYPESVSVKETPEDIIRMLQADEERGNVSELRMEYEALQKENADLREAIERHRIREGRMIAEIERHKDVNVFRQQELEISALCAEVDALRLTNDTLRIELSKKLDDLKDSTIERFQQRERELMAEVKRLKDCIEVISINPSRPK